MDVLSIYKLVKKVEKSFIGLLLQHNLVKLKEKPSDKLNKDEVYKLSNIVLVREVEYKLTTKQINDFRFMFPSVRRGSVSIVRSKLERFLMENPETSYEEIFEVTKSYIDKTLASSGEERVKSANNIAFKKVKGGEESLLSNLLNSYNIQNQTKSPLNKIDLTDYEEDL